jgi:acyl carrier protein
LKPPEKKSMNEENTARLAAAFAEALGVDISTISDDLTYNSIPEWDSVAHMALVAAIEEAFDIMIDTEDVIDMSSFAKAKDIVKKYQ